MKRYWHFVLVGIICLLVALLWAQPQSGQAPAPQALTIALPDAPAQQSSTTPTSQPAARDHRKAERDDTDQPLPGSSSSLPLLAVIGFGVLAGGITSAMRTR